MGADPGLASGEGLFTAGDRMLCCKHLLTIFFFMPPLSFGVCCRWPREVSGELVFPGERNSLSLVPRSFGCMQIP